jgi:hypothetical protein
MNDPTNISGRLFSLRRQRSKKMKELMREYDETVYYPEIQKLQKQCLESGGHIRGKFHNNGIGWTWYYCARCDASFDKEGYL